MIGMADAEQRDRQVETVRPPRQGRFEPAKRPRPSGRATTRRIAGSLDTDDDGERRAHILDEARADDVETGRDAVDHRRRGQGIRRVRSLERARRSRPPRVHAVARLCQ